MKIIMVQIKQLLSTAFPKPMFWLTDICLALPEEHQRVLGSHVCSAAYFKGFHTHNWLNNPAKISVGFQYGIAELIRINRNSTYEKNFLQFQELWK
jgi:hypothetical protein